MSSAPALRPALVITDVDGTLVTQDKRLTAGALAAVRRLDAAGIAFTLVSSRPARGMAALVRALDVRRPFAAFNGANLVNPDMTVISAHRLAEATSRRAVALLEAAGVDVWVFHGGEWRLRDALGPKVAREQRTVGFDPIEVADLAGYLGAVDKIVGVSDDHPLLARVEAQARAELGADAAVQLSQPYYLDITHPLANKGAAVTALCGLIGVAPEHTAVIGDMFNDVAMFGVAGFSIAMGQAPVLVRQAANVTTLTNEEDGFAHAIERLILAAPEAG